MLPNCLVWFCLATPQERTSSSQQEGEPNRALPILPKTDTPTFCPTTQINTLLIGLAMWYVIESVLFGKIFCECAFILIQLKMYNW